MSETSSSPKQSLAGRIAAKLMPAAASRVFPSEWLEVGDDQAKLIAIAKKRRALDGPRPDLVLGRKWKRATTEIGGHDLHLLTPKAGSTGRVLFYCHGGAFVVGPSALEWLFATKFASAVGCDLALYDYPRVPEVDSSAILETTMAAYDAIEARYRSEDIVMAGTSAGGGLAVSTLLQLQRAERPRPAIAVLFSPWLDMSTSHPDAEAYDKTDLMLPIETLRRDGELYAGTRGLTDPLVSPRFTSADELVNLPPMVVTVGDSELFFPEAQEFVDGVVTVGAEADLVVETHGQHASVLGPGPEAAAALAECVALVNGYRSRTASS